MKAIWKLALAAVTLSATTANAGLLVTPLGPSVGIASGNVDIECIVYNAGTKSMTNVTVSERSLDYCSGATCFSSLRGTATCPELAPGESCRLFHGPTFTSGRFSCSFQMDGSAKAARAGMSITDTNTSEALVYIPATGK